MTWPVDDMTCVYDCSIGRKHMLIITLCKFCVLRKFENVNCIQLCASSARYKFIARNCQMCQCKD